jgi:hypothetical protein
MLWSVAFVEEEESTYIVSSSSRPNGGVTSLKIKCTSIRRTSVDGGTSGTADDVQPLVVDVPVKLTQRTRLHADVGSGEIFAGLKERLSDGVVTCIECRHTGKLVSALWILT